MLFTIFDVLRIFEVLQLFFKAQKYYFVFESRLNFFFKWSYSQCAMCDVEMSYQPINKVEPTLKCLLGWIYIYISLDYMHRIPVMKWEIKLQRQKVFRGCSCERELARLDGLPHLGEISICFRNSYKSTMCSYEKWASRPKWDLTWFSVDLTRKTPRFSSPARWDKVL